MNTRQQRYFALLMAIMCAAPACLAEDEPSPLYVLLEEIFDAPDAHGTPVQVAVTTAGTMFVAEGDNLLRYGDTGFVGANRSGLTWSVLGANNGELIVAHPDGCDVTSDDGATWQTVATDWFGANYVHLGQFRGSDTVLALTTGPDGFRLLESPGGCTDWTERSNGDIRGFSLNRVSFIQNTAYVQMIRIHELGVDVIKLYGEDGGRTWSTVNNFFEGTHPMAETPDGLVIAPGSFGLLYTDKNLSDVYGASAWNDVEIPGPERDPVHDWVHVDHQGVLYYGARFRSVHLVTRDNLGRAIALAGPGCGKRDSIDHTSRNSFESQVAIANNASVPLHVSRHDSNGNVIAETIIAAGSTESVVSRKNSWWELHDANGICYRLFEHTADDQQVTVEDVR